MKDKTFNLRMTAVDRQRLEALSKHFGDMSGANVVRMLIKAEYDKVIRRPDGDASPSSA